MAFGEKLGRWFAKPDARNAPTGGPETESPAMAPLDRQILELQALCDTSRHRDDIADFLAPGSVGIELGVAFGGFSSRLLARNATLHLYGVDMYAGDRNHDTHQYCQALQILLPYTGRTQLIRARFDEVVHVFPDHFFDFIYVDGYAHTGEEDGETFRQWLPKLKPCGIMAGDDYDPAWPKVMTEVDRFVADNGFTMFQLSNAANLGPEYPQWFVVNATSGQAGLQTTLADLSGRFRARLPATASGV